MKQTTFTNNYTAVKYRKESKEDYILVIENTR